MASNIPYDPIGPIPGSPRTPYMRDSVYSESRAPSIAPYRDDPNGSRVALEPMGFQDGDIGTTYPRKPKARKRGLVPFVIIGLIIVIVAAALVPIYFFVIRPRLGKSNDKDDAGVVSNGNNNNNNNHHNNDDKNTDNSKNLLVTGGDGTEVTMDDGTKFTYTNTFGGYWVFDPANPLNESARAQEWTPSLEETFNYGVDKIRGVNLGGWLNLEPFISPALYQPFEPDALDEYTLSQLIFERDGNLDAIEEHYKTFITEQDFAMIAGAGLNFIRLPIGFWAIEKYENEPYLERVSWTYFLKAVQWARKYGLRINLDFHALPGSQNGWNHSGKAGSVNFLNGVMGVANAQRTMDYIRIFAEFISQPEYRNVVPIFGIINEPRIHDGSPGGVGFPRGALESFYAEAYRVIREVGGTGAGNGPYVSLFHGFAGVKSWTGFLEGADRLAMDHHPYWAFEDGNNAPISSFVPRPCTTWAQPMTTALRDFGLITAGEWSNAINDCGLYLNAVGLGTRYESTFPGTEKIPAWGSCKTWNDWESWTPTIKSDLKDLMMTSMDSLQNYFFWTWRIGESVDGKVETPFWSYKLALENGWAPLDPREAEGHCDVIGSPITRFEGPLLSWQEGGTGAGVVPSLDNYDWPPTTPWVDGTNPETLPRYTATGPMPTMPVQKFEDSDVDVGDGWYNEDDKELLHVPQDGCRYPDQWNATHAVIPTGCGAPVQPRPGTVVGDEDD